jgi:hypothetical protein
MAGTYFDSTLTRFAGWPASGTTHFVRVSVVQDPFETPPDVQTFAQPLVFHQLAPFSQLAASPILRKVPALRLRVPARPLARYLSVPGALPALSLLDVSTSSLAGAELDALLARLPALAVLLADGAGLVRGALGGENWAELGRAAAAAGVRRAKDRERVLRAWLERHAAQLAPPPDTPGGSHLQAAQPQVRRPAKGRKGLASATVSMRDAPAQSTKLSAAVEATIPKIRVLPSFPTLRALATTLSLADELVEDIDFAAHFADGWRDGIKLVKTVRARLRTSAANGVRVVRFEELSECAADAPLLSEDGIDGLRDILPRDAAWDADECAYAPPVLCLVGPSRQATHPEGCAHRRAWEVWND